MSTKSHTDLDDSNGLLIGVEQSIKKAQLPDLRNYSSISSIILTVTIFHVYDMMVRTYSQNVEEANSVRKGDQVPGFSPEIEF